MASAEKRSSILSSRTGRYQATQDQKPKTADGDISSVDNTAVTARSSLQEIPDSGKPDDLYAYTPTYLRRWMIFRSYMREYIAEFMGTAILVIFGNGVNCQVVLSGDPNVAAWQQGSYLSINLGWGVGTAIGVWLSAGISGGHINPAVTVALATWRGFPWRKVPGYVLAQVLGGLVGSAIVYGNYYQAINVFEGGTMRTEATRGLFATYSLPYMSNIGAFFDEFIGTLILMIAVLAVGDTRNSPPPAGLAPLVLFLLVTGIGTSFGMQTAYAINPARDLGPRLMTTMAGWGKEVFTYRNQYWIWCPILGPIMGAQVASFFYDAFLYTGAESPAAKSYIPRPRKLPRAQEPGDAMV